MKLFSSQSAVAPQVESKEKHPVLGMILVSGKIIYFSIRHINKPLCVDYNTGQVWLDNGQAA